MRAAVSFTTVCFKYLLRLNMYVYEHSLISEQLIYLHKETHTHTHTH
jgi:hypothetical protein